MSKKELSKYRISSILDLKSIDRDFKDIRYLTHRYNKQSQKIENKLKTRIKKEADALDKAIEQVNKAYMTLHNKKQHVMKTMTKELDELSKLEKLRYENVAKIVKGVYKGFKKIKATNDSDTVKSKHIIQLYDDLKKRYIKDEIDKQILEECFPKTKVLLISF